MKEIRDTQSNEGVELSSLYIRSKAFCEQYFKILRDERQFNGWTTVPKYTNERHKKHRPLMMNYHLLKTTERSLMAHVTNCYRAALVADDGFIMNDCLNATKMKIRFHSFKKKGDHFMLGKIRFDLISDAIEYKKYKKVNVSIVPEGYQLEFLK